MNEVDFDVVVVGGGPAGLSAALLLGRARKRVLLTDAGSPRNARALEVHNFLTRDGTPPQEMRRIAREQLSRYPSVAVRGEAASGIGGEIGAFTVALPGGAVTTRRVLLCGGLVDELPDIEGFSERWGRSIVQCPYCHGWEARDQPFGYLAASPERAEWAILLRGWSDRVTVLTDRRFEVPSELRERLLSSGVLVEEREIAGLRGQGDQLSSVALADGSEITLHTLFAHPPQRQTDLVRSLGLALDAVGFVRVSAQGETSRPGISAAGDLATPLQAAIAAAGEGMKAAAFLNYQLTAEDALSRRG